MKENSTGNIFVTMPDLFTLTGSASLSLGQWNHVLVTWGGGTTSLYINGKLDSSSSQAITLDFSNSNYIWLSNVLSNGINATLDQFAVYTQSMQTAQVEQLYASELPRHMLAKVARWNLANSGHQNLHYF